MGCVTSGMVQTSPESSKNKVEPIPLKTDKVTRAQAKDERKSALAKHRSNAYNKAKSLSDKVLAEKETLSTSSTVRSSWSRSTAPTQVDSFYSQRKHGRKCATNMTSNMAETTTKSVHFENPEIRSDSGHFSDIPGLAEEQCETIKHDNGRTSKSDESNKNKIDSALCDTSKIGNKENNGTIVHDKTHSNMPLTRREHGEGNNVDSHNECRPNSQAHLTRERLEEAQRQLERTSYSKRDPMSNDIKQNDNVATNDELHERQIDAGIDGEILMPIDARATLHGHEKNI